MDATPETADRLRACMEHLNLSPAAFARECGVSRQRVNAWINNGSIPDADALRQLYRRRRISPMWIWWGDGEMVLLPPLARQKRDLVEFVANLPDEDAAACLAFLQRWRGAEQPGIRG